jgi:CRP-like cAMP-binding protein
MLEQQSLRLYPAVRIEHADRKRAISVLDSPRQNHLLAALPPDDYERLLPALERVQLPLGSTIYRTGEREKDLYFIATGLVSRLYETQAGASVALAVTGSEGVIGVASLLGGESTPSRTVVLSAGSAYRLHANLLKHEFEHNTHLLKVLLRYMQSLIAQTGQNAVCNRHHFLEQQLCRWILSCLDRLTSNELTMTHALIAAMLGVRREGVTEAARKLQSAGAIDYSRGHITVLDRRQLEAQACECYGAVKRDYDRLPRPQNTAHYPLCRVAA